MKTSLGDAQIGPFPDDFHLQLICINPDRIIGTVTGGRMSFMRGLHIGANAAEPEQVRIRLQQGVDQLVGRDRIL